MPQASLLPAAGPDAGIQRFCTRYPRVWHVIEADGLEGARLHGLRPAIELRALAGLVDDHQNRPDFLPLVLPGGGGAVLRPQLMLDADLTPTLAGAYLGRPDLWRRLIDSHVFFWATADRRDRFLNAVTWARRQSPGARSSKRPVMLEWDTQALLTVHGAAASYSVINTGSTVRGGARTRRDETTFRPVAEFASEKKPAAELAIRATVRFGDGLVSPP